MFRPTYDTPNGASIRDRRKGKDRRKTIDPRYRNPAYPDFVDRRKRDRRKLVCDAVNCLVSEHPDSRLITTIGIVTAILLLSIFLLSTLHIDKVAEVKRAANIFCNSVILYIFPWSL